MENILSGEIEKKTSSVLYFFPLDDKIDNKYCIDIPEELKYVLVNDWDLVVHQKQLFKLPAKVSVNNIIELLRWVLSTTYFVYQGVFYKQIHGATCLPHSL